MANILNLFGFHLCMHRDGKYSIGKCFRNREIPSPVTQVFVCILKMQGEGIIDHDRNVPATEIILQLIPVCIFEDEGILVKYMG